MMRISVLALCLAGALPQASDPVEIGVSRTPGKPMMFHEKDRPAEEVVARKEGERFVLRVRVNVPRENVKKYTEESAELSAKEWASIVEIVSREKLLEWTPEGPEAPAPDWGRMGIRIKGDKENAQSWIKPIRNGDGVLALSRKLASLAREKVQGLPLYYLTP